MNADCHIHMLLDGQDWRRAIDGHRSQPDRELIRCRLRQYAEEGFTYLRDGGDRWGVGAAAREIAAEYGITYRTPLSPLCRAGHYGAFIGKKFENLKGYARLVAETRQRGGDFIKIMISGLMDFDRCGVLTEDGLAPELIAEMIHIAHEEGFAVMAHANGARTIETAARAGVESIEHGAYQDPDSMQAMVENGTVWCPTLSAIGNLMGKGRFDEEQVQRIYAGASENVRRFVQMGGIVAPGSDAGAWSVLHVQGGRDEYRHLQEALGAGWEAAVFRGVRTIQDRF